MLQINNYTLIVLPEGADEVKIIHNGTRLAWFKPRYQRIDLPPNATYTIVGKVRSLGMKGCRELLPDPIVYPEHEEWTDYENDDEMCKDPEDSLISLLRSKGMPPENTWVVKTV